MKYLKLYEQFRLNESSDWKKTLEINGKQYEIKWGMPKLELAEIFQTLNHHKSNLPKKWSDSFGVIFNSPSPEEFSHQTDPSSKFINKPLEASMKGKATPTNPEIKYSCYELLQLDSIGGKSGDDLVPYHNFIKEIHKAFWEPNGKKVQLIESQLQQLAENKAGEPGDNATGFHKVMLDDKFLDKFKIYYDIYVKTEDNTNGILDSELVTKAGCVDEIKKALPNMKEPDNIEHKEIWNKYRVSNEDLEKNPDAYQDFASEIYSNINNYVGYFGKSFKYFEDSIFNGKEMPLSAAVVMGGQLFLTGGNRRMTFYCAKKILPTIWVW